VVEKLKAIWMDGKLVDWDDAKIHVLTHSFHYGAAAFEGIRAYEQHDGKSAIFRLRDHIKRLFDSCQILDIRIPFTFEEVCEACKETLVANGLKEAYLRPVAYIGEGVMGVFPADNPIRLMVATWKWGAYLGETALKKGIRVKVSSYNRPFPNSAMTRAKLTGNYVTGVLAKKEAKGLGYDEGLLLDTEGYVAEGSGENVFIVRKGKIKTTPLTAILPGITRETVMTLAAENGLEVREERFTRDEVYIADEVFFCGTAAEITPIREVDGRQIGAGEPGPVTKKLQALYFDAIRGRSPRHPEWLEQVALPVAEKGGKKKAVASS
jgi:branched-chain amino acid aminotransferase